MLTTIILTKNEESNIIDCIDSVSFSDEIIIIDNYSTDNTQALIKNIKREDIHVYEHGLNDDFAAQRNFGLSKATNEWILFIDADERVNTNLKNEIVSVIKDDSSDTNGYFISRNDFIFGKKLLFGETGTTKLLRLGKKHKGEWMGKVHETWNIKGKTDQLRYELDHYPHQTIAEFISKVNFYTTLRAKELYAHKKKTSALFIVLYPVTKFFVNFVIKRGYKDGIEGLIVAIIMSFHSFLVRAKLWLMWQNT